MHLRVAAEQGLPWVRTQSHSRNVTISGPMSDLLKWIANALNFTYSVQIPRDHQWGVKFPNGSWSGMIGMLRRNEADLGLGPFSLNLDRFQDATTTLPISFDRVGILVRAADWEMNIFSLFQSFTWKVWILLLLSILVASCAEVMIDRFYGSKGTLGSQIFNEVWNFSKTVVNQESRRTPVRAARWILRIAWILSMVVLTIGFNSNFLATLMIRRVTQIQTLEQLYQHSHIQPAVEQGSSTHSFFMKENSAIGRGMFRRLESKRNESVLPLIELASSEMIDKVSRGTHAIIMDALLLKSALSSRYAEQRTCNFHFFEVTFLTQIKVMAFRRDFSSNIIKKVNKILWSVTEGQLIVPKINSMILNCSRCLNQEKSKADPLKLSDLQGLFALWGAGCSLALLVLLCEHVSSRRKKRGRNKGRT